MKPIKYIVKNFLTMMIAVFIPLWCSASELSIQIQTTPQGNKFPFEVDFLADASGGLTPYSYTWNLGDDTSSTLKTFSHCYPELGNYEVNLFVTDSANTVAYTTKEIFVVGDISAFDPENTMVEHYADISNIRIIQVDKNNKHILWLGTNGGIIKLDTLSGVRQVFINEYPGIYIEKIVQNVDGRLWFLTKKNKQQNYSSALVSFSSKNSEWTHFESDNNDMLESGINDIMISNDSTLWISTNDGIVSYSKNSDQWTLYGESKGYTVLNIYELSNGDMLARCKTEDLSLKKNEKTWNVSQHRLSSELVQDESGNFWYYGTVSHFISSLTITSGNPQSLTFTTKINITQIQNEERILEQLSDRQQDSPEIQIELIDSNSQASSITSTYISPISNEGKSLSQLFDRQQGSPTDIQKDVNARSRSRLFQSGFFKWTFQSNKWVPEFFEDSHSPFISSHLGTPEYVVMCNENIWYIHADDTFGSTVYTISSLSPGIESEFIHNRVFFFKSTGYDLWIGTDIGLVRFSYDRNEWLLYNQTNSDLPGNIIRSFYQTMDNEIWISANNHLSTYILKLQFIDHQIKKIYEYKIKSNISNTINCLIQSDNEDIWIGTDVGPAKYSYKKKDFNLYKQFYNNNDFFSTPDHSSVINSIIQLSDNSIIMGDNHGIITYEYDTNKWDFINKCSSPLPEIKINNLLIKKNDNSIFGATDFGLIQFQKDSLNKDSKILQGLKNLLFFEGGNCFNIAIASMIQSNNTDIWLASNKGLIRIENFNESIHLSKNNCSHNSIYNYFPDQYLKCKTNYLLTPKYSNLFEEHNCYTTTYQNSILTLDPIPSFTPYPSSSDLCNLLNCYTDTHRYNNISVDCDPTFPDQLTFNTINIQTKYNTENTSLPSNQVNCLLQSKDNKIWIGTSSGLSTYDYDQDYLVSFRALSNDLLSQSPINALMQTRDDAIWVGTNQGLVRISPESNEYTLFNQTNSSIPDYPITSLLQSKDGDIWAGTKDSGLLRLKMKPSGESPGKLILVAGGDASEKNELWETTYHLSKTTYRVFSNKHFKKSDIFFISPMSWVDINVDGFDDHVVDRPTRDKTMTLQDLEYAFTKWAPIEKNANNNLFVYLIGHGYDSEDNPYFQLSSDERLYASQLNHLLNAYESETNSEHIFIIIEACYAGDFISHIQKEGRTIITSTNNTIASYAERGTKSFSQFFIRKLASNYSIQDSYLYAKMRLGQYYYTDNQRPQLIDNNNMAQNVRIGNDIVHAGQWPEVISVVHSQVSQKEVAFTVTTNISTNYVWCSVVKPCGKLTIRSDTQEITPHRFQLFSNHAENTFSNFYNEFRSTGIYEFTFWAVDKYGNIDVYKPIKIYIAEEGHGFIEGKLNFQLEGCDISFNKENIDVHLLGTNFTANVDPDGTFSIYDIPFGSYSLEIKTPHFAPYIVPDINISNKQLTNLEEIAVQLTTLCNTPGCDGKVSLKDVIQFLKILTGIH